MKWWLFILGLLPGIAHGQSWQELMEISTLQNLEHLGRGNAQPIQWRNLCAVELAGGQFPRSCIELFSQQLETMVAMEDLQNLRDKVQQACVERAQLLSHPQEIDYYLKHHLLGGACKGQLLERKQDLIYIDGLLWSGT